MEEILAGFELDVQKLMVAKWLDGKPKYKSGKIIKKNLFRFKEMEKLPCG